MTTLNSNQQAHHHDQTVAINLNGDRTELMVAGRINFKNVVKLRRDGNHLFSQYSAPVIVVDLQGLQGSDNAGLVLLVAWLRDAAHAEKSLVYRNVPDFLQTMAEVFGLGSILFKRV